MRKERVQETESVKVSVRVRPLNKRENTECNGSSGAVIVSAIQKAAVVALNAPSSPKSVRGGAKTAFDFQFDTVFWSLKCPDARGGPPATQRDVYETIGLPLVNHAFNGFNSCLFAYGQTGSGKTYTMMGGDVRALGGEDSGVTPRICSEIFHRLAAAEQDGSSRWAVQLGYVEIYNERVSDLLAKRKKGSDAEVFVDVREHPQKGVFIEGQRFVTVASVEEIVKYMEIGNTKRHTAATKMNDRSSRSHAIVMLCLQEERTMTTKRGAPIKTAGKNSRMNLVDLAGSERIGQSESEGMRFTEATHINLSLTTLGRVVDILAEKSTNAEAKSAIPPFRESKLTFILKDSLGGNSKTFMVATVSPSALNYEETLSTLRYASRARDIVNVAQVNEDPRARRIRELEDEIFQLRARTVDDVRDPEAYLELQQKLALMESEAQKRAADLQALEKEREQNQLRDIMLKASKAEKDELAQRAADLEREVTLAQRQAAEIEADNMWLREEQVCRERELQEAMARKDAALLSVRRRKDAEIESGLEKLDNAMGALEREKEEKEGALHELQRHQERLAAAMINSAHSDAERASLRSQNADLLRRIASLTNEAEERDRLMRDLERVQVDCEELERKTDLLGTALEEMTARYHATVFHLLMRTDLATQWEDRIATLVAIETDDVMASYMHASTRDIDNVKSQRDALARLLDDREERLETLQSTVSTQRMQCDQQEGTILSLKDENAKLRDELAEQRNLNNKLTLDKKKYEAALSLAERELKEARIRLAAHRNRKPTDA